MITWGLSPRSGPVPRPAWHWATAVRSFAGESSGLSDRRTGPSWEAAPFGEASPPGSRARPRGARAQGAGPRGPGGALGASGRGRDFTTISWRFPMRSTASRNSWPTGAASTARDRASSPEIGRPSSATMRSPTRMPASAAGLPGRHPGDDQPRRTGEGIDGLAPPGPITRPR